MHFFLTIETAIEQRYVAHLFWKWSFQFCVSVSSFTAPVVAAPSAADVTTAPCPELWRFQAVYPPPEWAKMETVTIESSAAEEDECSDSEVFCLMRVGRHSDWLRLFENTEVQFANANELSFPLKLITSQSLPWSQSFYVNALFSQSLFYISPHM